MRKIIIDSLGRFKIETKPNHFIGSGKTSQIFEKDENLAGKFNPILYAEYKKLKESDVVSYMPFPEHTFEVKKNMKVNMFANKKEAGLRAFMINLYNQQSGSKYDNKIIACQDAKNQTELDKILDD